MENAGRRASCLRQQGYHVTASRHDHSKLNRRWLRRACSLLFPFFPKAKSRLGADRLTLCGRGVARPSRESLRDSPRIAEIFLTLMYAALAPPIM